MCTEESRAVTQQTSTKETWHNTRTQGTPSGQFSTTASSGTCATSHTHHGTGQRNGRHKWTLAEASRKSTRHTTGSTSH
jgi:hypothetical protein